MHVFVYGGGDPQVSLGSLLPLILYYYSLSTYLESHRCSLVLGGGEGGGFSYVFARVNFFYTPPRCLVPHNKRGCVFTFGCGSSRNPAESSSNFFSC